MLYFSALHGSSCWLGSIQALIYDPELDLIYTEAPILRHEGTNTCVQDAVPHVIMVGVDRSHLPAEGFELIAQEPYRD